MPARSDLRVLSGAFKGKLLKSPQNSNTHPMGSREKLALFNMLQPYLGGAIVLDAYAGTGALGIEALGRGANWVDFVEKTPSVARLIRENLQNLEDGVKSEIFTSSVDKFVREVSSIGKKYDLILADPPYDKFNADEIVELAQLLKASGILALSFPSRIDPPALSGMEPQTSRKYAAAGIAIYRKIL